MDKKNALIRTMFGLLLLVIGFVGVLLGFVGENPNIDMSGAYASFSSGILVSGIVFLLVDKLVFRHTDRVADELESYRKLFEEINVLSSDLFQTLIPVHCVPFLNCHTYHKTRRGGDVVWMYNPVFFRPDSTGSKIIGERLTINKSGASNTFDISAGVRGSKLIVFYTKTDSSVDCVVDVVHDFTNPNHTEWIGFRVHSTWDSDISVSPVIYSKHRFVGGRRSKPFVASEAEAYVLKEMCSGLLLKNKIKPLLAD